MLFAIASAAKGKVIRMSEFSRLKDKLLVEQVEDQLYHYILDTPLEPGSKLPNEFKLDQCNHAHPGDRA